MWSLIADFALGQWQWIAGAIGGLLALWGARRSGVKSEQNKQLKDTLKREKRGRDAVAREKADTRDASKRDLIDRLRSRDGSWM